MRNPVQHTITPGPDASVLAPVSPTTTFHARRRGRPALAGIASTAAFTNVRLTEPARQLVLLMLCSLERDETLTDAYEAVLAKYGDRPGHWCHGKDLHGLRHFCSKFLGRAARNAPTWEVLTDLFSATLPAPDCERLLPWAAWLWCRAHDVAAPPGYTGPITCPPWGERDVVAKAAIVAALRADQPPHPADPAPASCEPPHHEPREDHETLPMADTPSPAWEDTIPSENPRDLRVLLDYMTRVYRSQQEQNRRLHEQIQQLLDDNLELDHMTWDLRTQVAKLTQAAEKSIVEQDPSLTRHQVRQRLEMMIGRTRSPLPPLPRSRLRPMPVFVDHHDRRLAPVPPSA
ncbi:hypothetical protein [Amycolatopsis sp. TNS106]|uniref:hypothetical protein n=1 Tax=Amycolatopsis sp. TNS106 TaxID=2861750 RepID=UPI001C5667A2|nr:hypothetical protein [Amycolatopsis sp. TNS106]